MPTDWRRPPRAAKVRGFTLVEVLAAAGVFLLGLAGIMATDVAAGQQLAAAGRRERATSIADSLAQLVPLLPLQTVQGFSGGLNVSYDIDGNISTDPNFGVPFFSATVTSSTPNGEGGALSAVRVVVRWQDPVTRDAQEANLETWANAS